MKKRFRRKRFRALAAIFILTSIPATAALVVQWKLYRQNIAVDSMALRNDVTFSSATRALVVAPHCDDETLGCGGIIARTVQSGGQVTVVVVTNGDGSRSTAAREYHRWKPSPGQIQEMARMRQNETLKALDVLGVSASDVVFLGYPDRGVADLWERHWDPDHPYTSPFTQASRNPYGNSLRPDAVYCGQSVLEDVRAMITRVKPTDIFVSDPSDTHRDHWATHAFTCAALESLRARGGPIARHVRLWTYLIHRDGGVAESVKYSWPAPVGLHADLGLAPPKKLLQTNTSWHQVDLPADVVEQKRRAVLCYDSQIGTMRKFMFSFVRKSELLGSAATPTLPVAKDRDSSGTLRVIRDPTRDGFARDVVPNGDVKAVHLGAHDKALDIRVELYARPSRRVKYQLELTGVDRKGEVRRVTLRMQPAQHVQFERIDTSARSVAAEGVASCVATDRSLCATVPAELLGDASSLLVSASTRLGRIQLDRTALRVVRVDRPASASVLSRRP